MQKQVGDAARHDEDNQHARDDEGKKKAKKDTPAQIADRQRAIGGIGHDETLAETSTIRPARLWSDLIASAL
jgi:hypothetical protein